MTHVRLTLTTIAVMVCAIVSTTMPVAGAHEFSATAMGLLTLKPLINLRLVNKSGTIECSVQKLTAGEAALSAKTTAFTVQYSGCKAFGLAATLSPAQYEFNAEGSVSLVRTMTLKATGCLMTWPSSKNQHLSSMKYTQMGNAVAMTWFVTSMTSFGTGATCEYAEESKGTVEDVWWLALASGAGSVEWK